MFEHGKAKCYPEETTSAATNWIILLEEHEILFPKTRELRLHLVTLSTGVGTQASEMLSALIAPEPAEAIRARATKLFDAVGNLNALLEDLRVYLQNETLGPIAGHSVPYRQPLDHTLPRVLIDSDGTPYVAAGPDAPRDRRLRASSDETV
jgi:hypothetical protein